MASALLLAELLSLTELVDTDDLHAAGGLARFAGDWGAAGLRMFVLAIILTAVFGVLGTRRNWKAVSPGGPLRLVSPGAAGVNLGAFAAFAFFSLQLFSPHTSVSRGDLLAVPCVLAGVAMLISAALVFVPVGIWIRMFHAAPFAPVYGFVVTVAVAGLAAAGEWIWVPWMRLTYQVALGGLHLLRSDVVADAAHFTLGTTNFSVTVASGCSGYEGVALMLAFGSAWLWFFRGEFRFPQALLLLPVGAAAIWVLNCARIIALILIGDAGAPAIAAGGFHSEAGWISFIVLSAGLLLASQRIPWIAVIPPSSGAEASPLRSDETAAYLMPFLAILAAGMVAHAATATFEWLYPLRVAAAGAALWWSRRVYAGLQWRIGWEPVGIGAVVFVLWIGAEQLMGAHGGAVRLPPELAAASAFVRFGWLAFRVAGAVATVPLAEEMAFRGYALRRLQSADFTKVDLRRFSFMPLAVSSLLFGVLHGRRWIVGTIAGALYALAARRRGNIVDAAAAHAVTNALLAAWVLTTGDWTLW